MPSSLRGEFLNQNTGRGFQGESGVLAELRRQNSEYREANFREEKVAQGGRVLRSQVSL